MSPDPRELPPFPRERDYPGTAQGAMDFARDIGEWMRTYTDLTDKHRRSSVEMWTKEFGNIVKENHDDLQPPNAARPGWVAVAFRETQTHLENFIEQVARDNIALLEDNDSIRQEIKWFKRIALTTLISFAVYVTQQLVQNGSIR